VVTSVEHLRIVSDDVWAGAHEALENKQKVYGFKRGFGRPAGAFDSKHLLTGMVVCGVCGGTIEQAVTARNPAYGCWYNHSRGRAVCSNGLVVDMPLADETVLRAVAGDVLDPQVAVEALELALRELEQPASEATAGSDTLRSELA